MRLLRWVLCLVFAATGLLPVNVLAGPAEDAAVATHDIRQKYCAEAATEKNTEVAKALKEIMPVFVQVSEVYDATGEDFLLYWRGVLQECIGKEELAEQDLDTFLESKEATAAFPDLAADARRRLRRMRAAAKRGAVVAGTESRAPAVLLGLGGGAQLLAVPELADFSYGLAQIDLSLRLGGPVRILLYSRFGFSDTYAELDVTRAETEAEFLSLLTLFGAGLVVRVPGPAQPRFGALLQLAPNPEHEQFSGAEQEVGGAFLVGVAGLIGVDIPMGASVASLRPQAEIGFLGRGFVVRLSLGAVVAFP